ncbi:MAG: amidohydrolase [Bacillota bacterium]|nr:amidohydrolase [Bacillota bacterium]
MTGEPRVLVTGGDIVTLDPFRPRPEAMVVGNGHVLALGPRDELTSRWGGGASRLDLDGRALLPGFTDSHLHLLSYGLMLDQVQLAGCPSVRLMTELVAEGAAALAKDEWVLGRGWDQDLFAERRYPARGDLDPVTAGRPALLTRGCGHCSVANSRALELAGITRDTIDPPGGRIERDPATGEPTGVLHERAAGLVRSVIGDPGFGVKRRGLERAMGLALSAGLVAVHPDDVRSAGDAATACNLYRELLPSLGGPRVRLDVSEFALDELLASGLRTGSGDPMLSIGAVKLFVDGSLGARSAALTRPYADDPGQSGIVVQERSAFMGQVRRAHAHGLQVAIHAIGDLAVDWSLDAIEAAQQAGPAWEPRHRVVHVQITRPDQPPRFAALGAVAEIQPKFVTTDKLWVDARVGPERARTSYCWKTLLDAGVHCAGGSDGPVEPLHPLLGLYAAVTRQGLDGQPAGGWYPDQRLSVEQALRLFTLGGAYAGHSEQWRGSLSPGKAADFVLLDRAPDRVDPGSIKDLAVLATYIGGRCVFEA